MIVCGPVPLTERMAVPDGRAGGCHRRAPAREWAWKQIENARPGPVDAAEIGEMEPPALRRG